MILSYDRITGGQYWKLRARLTLPPLPAPESAHADQLVLMPGKIDQRWPEIRGGLIFPPEVIRIRGGVVPPKARLETQDLIPIFG